MNSRIRRLSNLRLIVFVCDSYGVHHCSFCPSGYEWLYRESSSSGWICQQVRSLSMACLENTPCLGNVSVFTEANENLILQAKAVISKNLLKVSFELNGRELSNGFNTVTSIHMWDNGIAYEIISLHVPLLDPNYLPTGRYVDETFAQIEVLVRPTWTRKLKRGSANTS